MSIPLPNPSSAPSNVTSLVDRRLLHETVIDQLRDLIVQGELAPETKLNERVLAERLGTSRTPLREAIKFLASEGLVELLPNRGAVVAPLTPVISFCLLAVRVCVVLLVVMESQLPTAS